MDITNFRTKKDDWNLYVATGFDTSRFENRSWDPNGSAGLKQKQYLAKSFEVPEKRTI